MPKYALALAATPLLASPALAQVQVESSGPIVSLGITENVSLDPDIANLGAGVTTVEPTAVEAMRANARTMNRVVGQIEELGIDRDDIQTSGISLNPEYRYNQPTGQQVFQGYRASNRVNIVVRDIDEVGRVLDALVAVGANDIGGIGWSVDDSSEAIEQARQTAFRTGRERALDFARMAGFSNVRLLEISENVQNTRPMHYANEIAVTASAVSRDQLAPVRPGQVQVGVSVNFTYELVQ
ncbi:SIMPL domain-containing protein [Aurantiacibacter sp. D1-12]|uniref:SIMPL domain-containing protein n=1 Tax=Aurantiacibacter sp. D1-12 TaxID=2993658 RepID=UPI00237D315E|nr:SIMPL domain-containing protein [Aurantiacibacter sp. D1-12]MDE1466415.1 SIMPL domain-containing protein [Aurantiacibacter sp. D1-12]